jgi:hypothetical protein
MPIRFKCPNPECQKPLVVKDHLAGKKLACPHCKKTMTIRAPVSKPANVEDLAAHLLADRPPPTAEIKAPAAIKMTCQWCGEDVSFSADLGGKQAPCPNPECKRILKVPKPKEEPKEQDWRKTAPAGPSATKENIERQQKMLEEAWTTADKRKVGMEAMVAAGAVETPVEEVRPAEKARSTIRRVVLFTALAAVAGGGCIAFINSRRISSEEANIQAALDAFKEVKKGSAAKSLTPEMEGEMYRAAGEFYSRHVDPKPVTAREYFLKARSALLAKGAIPPERELLLTEIALGLIDLGGNMEEAEIDKVKLTWKDVQTDLARTLRMISSADGRAIALRRVAAKLLERDQGHIALALALDLASDDEQGGDARRYTQIKAQQVPLYLALKKTDKAAEAVPEPKAGAVPDPLARMAWCEGKAREGDFARAVELAQAKGTPLERLQALVAVAAAGMQAKKADDARPALQEAIKLVEGDKKAKFPPVLLAELVRLSAAAGEPPDRLKAVLAAIGDPGAKAQAELALLRHAMQADPAKAVLPDDDRLQKAPLAYAQLLETIARVKTRHGDRAWVDTQLGTQNHAEHLRPFLHAGIALGEQDP